MFDKENEQTKQSVNNENKIIKIKSSLYEIKESTCKI